MRSYYLLTNQKKNPYQNENKLTINFFNYSSASKALKRETTTLLLVSCISPPKNTSSTTVYTYTKKNTIFLKN
jgi:hypothetical protein